MTSRRVVGVDLAGSEDRPTGLCFLSDRKARTKQVYDDKEILEEIGSFSPLVAAIDAPLSLPLGKKLNSRYCVRKCDEELRKFRIKFFPINFAGMRKLTERGIRLRRRLEEMGIETIETYPGAFYDLIGLPRPKSRKIIGFLLKAMTERFDLEYLGENPSPHELDSIACALVGFLYLKGDFISLGDPEEGIMILPRPRRG
ncbi:MAG: DUF429 domain-containing protein [Thermoproteota archaeon]|nr:MAG: DUF429 domain-containing protein [Candidatus Korarchaeota archaeon]